MIGTAQQQFIDSVFGIRDLADPSKLGQFDASAISADTARVLAFPNASGTIALEGWVDDNFLALDGEGTDVVNGTFNLTTTGLGTFGSLTAGGLTASRLLSTDANKILVSSDLYSWVTETSNQVLIADDGDGSITLSTPQDIHTGASPTFAGGTFTGTVTGIDPVASNHLATKEYVDSAISFINDFFLTDDASTGGYFDAAESPTGAATGTLTTTGLTEGDGKPLDGFITPSGFPGVTALSAGVYNMHFHIQRSAGNRDYTIYFELWTRTDPGGAETLRTTSENSTNFDDDSENAINIHATLASDIVINATDRLVWKLFANMGVGNATNLGILTEGTTNSHVSIPTTTEVLSSVFVRQDGTKELSGNWGVGGFDITGIGAITSGAITSSGASTFNSGSVDADFTVNWNTGTGLFVQGSDGRVGVGTAAPNAPLEVKGTLPGIVGGFYSGHLHVTGEGDTLYSNSVITGHSSYNGNTQLWYLGSMSSSNNDIEFRNRQNAAMHFSTNNADRMIIDASGNVGIGLTTVDANYKLIIRRTANINLGVGLQSSELAIAAFNDALSANIPMRFYASEYNLLNGKVGINTTTPVSQLSINGGLHVGGDSDAGDNNLLVDGTIGCGVITQSGTTLANTYQPLDAGLTSLAGLTYAAASFVKMTGANAFALRTIGETADDLEGTIDHNNLANTHASNIFSTIAVSGQSNIVADSDTDTLTIVAGTNVTITTDAGADSVTINSSGGGGGGALNDLSDVTITSVGTGEILGYSGGWINRTLAEASIQPLDAGLTSLAALSYVSASFVKMTGANAFALRTIGETADDLEGTIDHANLSNLTIAAHDTTATGANLTSLTDNSIVNSLHRHSELVASDGTPDPALSVDATGQVGIGTATPGAALDVTGDITINNVASYRARDTGGTPRSVFYMDANNDSFFQAKSGQAVIIGVTGTPWMRVATGGISVGNASTAKTLFTVDGTITIKEQAAADGDTAGYGQLWCKDNAGTTELWFTDDSGTDTKIV